MSIKANIFWRSNRKGDEEDREYSITDKFICNAVEFDSNNLPCT